MGGVPPRPSPSLRDEENVIHDGGRRGRSALFKMGTLTETFEGSQLFLYQPLTHKINQIRVLIPQVLKHQRKHFKIQIKKNYE